MASLIEKTPCDGLLPLSIGAMTLVELPWRRVSSVAPFAGRDAAVAAALAATGLGWPAPNTALFARDAAIVWSGRGQAMLVGADPAPLAGLAALTDQSDGWARLRISGEGHAAALARLVAVDLREAAFPAGAALRTALGHMMAIFIRPEPGSVDIMVFRSMAATAVHEIGVAMRAVSARQTV